MHSLLIRLFWEVEFLGSMALAAVFISSVFFLLLTLTGFREKLINAIPVELKYAVGAGIGLFITFVGFQNSGIIVKNDATLVGLR